MAAPDLLLSPTVAGALKAGLPVVALESTVITHGLPYPQNLRLARDMEDAVRAGAATPATIALLDGRIRIGLADAELARLSETTSALKVSQRDLAAAIVKKASGGTTVAATMFLAHRAGIRVFATGGIGGVHRESPFDVSTDLRALSEIPMIVVCAGAKAVLDLPATLEYLETTGVPVVGYRTDEFPAFYSRASGLPVSLRLDSPQEIAGFAERHHALGLHSAVLVANPVPEPDDIPRSAIEPIIEAASRAAAAQAIHGQALTPFLLKRINELTEGRSLRANLSLLLNNARLAAAISQSQITDNRRKEI